MRQSNDRMLEPLIIGESAAIKELKSFIKKAARSDANVLILGETGVGKELAAKAIHFESSRRNKRFIKISSSSLNENLIESELFGYRKGAFTGAIINKPGLLETAGGGTFLFDEIGDISSVLQAKLLAVVEDKEIRRLGENDVRKIDVRFIFATNKDLHSLVLKERFRDDLFYRIAILVHTIAPLRERREDIPLLANHILAKENLKRHENTQHEDNIQKELAGLYYGGNVRELENIIRRAVALSNGNKIECHDIIPDCISKQEERKEYNKIFNLMLAGKGDFWNIVHKPFLKRELNTKEVKEIIILGLERTQGRYKGLLKLFNLKENEKDYKRFMKILRTHRININRSLLKDKALPGFQ